MSPRDDLSMSTDNTAEGRMYSDTVEAGPISHVEIGDTVFDSNGKDVGKVKFVKMGDPDAATDKGQWTYEGGILGLATSTLTSRGPRTASLAPARSPGSSTTRST